MDLLTEMRIDAGEQFVRKSDERALGINAALWFYFEESDRWKLLISTSDVKKEGPKFVYRKIQRVLNKYKLREVLPLSDLSLVDSDEPLLQALKDIVVTGRSLVRMRFSGNVVNGLLISDSLIYRIDY